MNVVWHDIECGGYAEDLALWRELGSKYGDPVLELGAGTGRVALDLARLGHDVTALDHDPELLGALAQRASGLRVQTVAADARSFSLGRRFALCIAPMQTVQLLGGAQGRAMCLRCVKRHLEPRGLAAFALSPTLDPYELAPGAPSSPLPDIAEVDGIVYSSQPTAVREQTGSFVLVRRRERVNRAGVRTATEDRIALDGLSAQTLEAEAQAAGLRLRGRAEIAATREYVASTVVMVGA